MKARDIASIQQALKATGFDPGKIDGIWGRNTIAALRGFQRARGITIDGIYGPETAQHLFAQTEAPAYDAPWMSEAARLLNMREVRGKENNPDIIKMAVDIGVPYRGDDIPWCGLFVGHCIATTLPEEALPDDLLWARNWEKFGKPIKPRLGAVMVFWREPKKSGVGHVGFYAGENNDEYLILGGNQGDSVSFKRMPRSEFLEARWPATAIDLAKSALVVDVGSNPQASLRDRLV